MTGKKSDGRLCKCKGGQYERNGRSCALIGASNCSKIMQSSYLFDAMAMQCMKKQLFASCLLSVTEGGATGTTVLWTMLPNDVGRSKWTDRKIKYRASTSLLVMSAFKCGGEWRMVGATAMASNETAAQ